MTKKPPRYRLRLSKANQIDFVQTAGLINRAFSRHEILVGDRTTPDDLAGESGPDGEFLQVFTEDGSLVASVLMRKAMPDDGDVYERGERAVYLALAAVDERHTKIGLGTELVREAERIARARGYRIVVLGTVREFDLVPYFEARGYSVVHTQVFDSSHWSIELLHHYCEMQKAVTPSFRLAREDEVVAVTNLVNLAYRVEDFFIDGNRTTEAEIADLIALQELLLMLDSDEQIIGAVHFKADGDLATFGMLSLLPDRQREGLGRVMLETVEQRAVDSGCSVLELQVVHLRDVLPDWYRRLGFVEAGTRPFPDPWKLRTSAHMIVMRKALDLRGEGKEFLA